MKARKYEAVQSALAAALRELRLEAGLTQKALAESMGVTVQAISHLEQGPDARLSTLIAWCNAVGVSLAELSERIQRRWEASK